MSPNAVLAWLRRRWWVPLALFCFLVAMGWLAQSAIRDSAERRASRARIEASAAESARLARNIEAQTEDLKRLLTAVDSATSQDARDRQAATLGYAIGELRRSIDCVALYLVGERPPACTEVARRMDAIRAGEDPFPRPPAAAPPQPPQSPRTGEDG